MAATYQIVTQRPNTQYIGGTTTVAGMSVGFVTKPNGVYAEVFVPNTDYNTGEVNAAVMGMALIMEELFSFDDASGVAWSQRVNDSNLLVDQVTIYVESDSGNSTGSLTVDVVNLGPQLHKPQLDALKATLNATEAA